MTKFMTLYGVTRPQISWRWAPDYNLMKSISAGLLLSYSPVLETGGDGKPNKVALARHGRGYHQTLYALLNEVRYGVYFTNFYVVIIDIFVL